MRFPFPLLSALLLCSAVTTPALASRLAGPASQETLVFLSSDIVEATVGERADTPQHALTTITLTHVYYGSHRQGEAFTVAGLSDFRTRDKPGEINPRPFAPGDRVLLFLHTPPPELPRPPAEGAATLAPLSFGVYRLTPDAILRPSQESVPGPIVAWQPDTLAPAQFIAALERDIATIVDLRAGLKSKHLPEDFDWFAAELAKRNISPHNYGFESISPALIEPITESRNPTLILKAIPFARDPALLLAGLRFAAGRDALLGQLADAKAPLATRLLLARSLSTVGLEYADDHGKPPPNLPAAERAENRNFIVHLAELANSPATPADLVDALLEGLWQAYPSSRSVISATVPFTEDRNRALALLRSIHERPTTRENVRFLIEALTLRADRDAYAKLHCPCGIVPTLVLLGFPPQPPRVPDARPGMFSIAILRETCALPEDERLGYVITATNLDSSKEYILYSESDHGGLRWSAEVALPADAPWGSYAIRCVTTQNGQKYHGHGFTLTAN